MEINLPSRVRAIIYITVVMGTALIVPLYAAGIVSNVLMAVWTSVSGAASALAAVNVTPDEEV